MNFRQIAEQDLAITLEDSTYGFGWPITITDPDLKTETVNGQTNDISFQIDPNTGLPVSGRIVEIAVRIASLVAAGFSELPAKQGDTTKKPWVFVFDDINGNSGKFTVKEANPDRSIGLVLCQLEFYQ